MKTYPLLKVSFAASLALFLGDAAVLFFAGAAESPAPTARAEDTNSLDTLRAYLQVQEQLHATQLAIERNRKEADEASARTAEALANRLQAIEQSVALQRSRELDAMQSSNHAMLFVAGAFATIGLLAMVL